MSARRILCEFLRITEKYFFSANISQAWLRHKKDSLIYLDRSTKELIIYRFPIGGDTYTGLSGKDWSEVYIIELETISEKIAALQNHRPRTNLRASPQVLANSLFLDEKCITKTYHYYNGGRVRLFC